MSLPAPGQPKPPLYRSLYFQVIVAIVAAVLLGYFRPATAMAMQPLGDWFVNLVKLMIAPIIFCTVVIGIAGMEDMKKVGKTGGLALLYFEVMSTLALIVGLVVVNTVRPGAGMNTSPATLDPGAAAKYIGPGKVQSISELLLHFIPRSITDALFGGAVLLVLVFALVFGFALHRYGGRNTPVFMFVEQASRVLFAVIGVIMRLAPIGAFGAMAYTIGKHGVGSLTNLAWLMGSFYATCLIFIFGVLGVVAHLHGFSIWKFVRYIKEELLIVLGTSSSEAALPRMLAKMETLGVRKSTVGLVIPTGYSFNLDGTAIYLTMAAVFIAQATNTPLDLVHQLTLLAVLLLTSKGAAGVTGSGFVVLAATLSAVGNVPVAGLGLILGIDRFMSEARALTNIVGNGVATVVVGKWCGEVDEARLQRQLNRVPELPDSAPQTPLADTAGKLTVS